MKNFSLKYLIIGVILLSALIILGALLFSKIRPGSSQKQPLNQASQKPTTALIPKGINPATGGETNPASTPNLQKP